MLQLSKYFADRRDANEYISFWTLRIRMRLNYNKLNIG